MGFPDGWKIVQPFIAHQTTGAGANYQCQITLYYGKGENTANTLYLAGEARTDFGDVRFCDENHNLLSYHIPPASLVVGVSCTVRLKVSADLNVGPALLFVYYGNPAATSLSNADNTYVAHPIAGVVAAYPLDEADAEVDPLVLAATGSKAFWTSSSATVTSTNNGDFLDAVWTNSPHFAGINHAANMDLTAKSVVRFTCKGGNSGASFSLAFKNFAYTHGGTITIVDNFIGEKTFVVPYSSFSPIGTPDWSALYYVQFQCRANNFTGAFSVGRLVVDNAPVALDKSGNGNDGVATCTTVVPSPFYTGQNARLFGGTCYVSFAAAKSLTKGKTQLSFCFQLKTGSDVTTAQAIYYESISSRSSSRITIYINAGTIQANYRAPDSMGSATLFTNSVAIAATTIYDVVVTYDSVNDQGILYLNKIVSAKSIALNGFDNTVPQQSSVMGGGYNGGTPLKSCVLANFFITSNILTQDQVNAKYGAYPDFDLITGSVCPRKYVYPEPVITFRPPFTRESSINVVRTQDAAPRTVLEGALKLLEFRRQKRRVLSQFLS